MGVNEPKLEQRVGAAVFIALLGAVRDGLYALPRAAFMGIP